MRIGVVGCGAIAQFGHIPALLRSPHATLAAVCDTDRAWAVETGRRHHVDHCSSDYRDMVGAVDGVIVATPTASHLPIASHFLRRGVHVLCEKPAALSSSEVHEMFAAGFAGGARLLVGQSRRFSRQAMAVRRLLDEGAVGPVHTFVASLGGVYSGWKARTDFRLDRRVAGGGVLIDSGIHLLDLAVWLLAGEPSLVEYVESRPPGWEVEGDAEVDLRLGQSSASIACSYTHGLRAGLRIEGESGWIEADLNAPNVQFFSSRSHVCRVDGAQWIALRVQTDYEAQLEHFCRCVRDEQPFVVSEPQVVSVIEIVEACYRGRDVEKVEP